jgi:hypothetical protein
MQSDLKWDKQYSKAVNTANCVLGMIKRSFLLFKQGSGFEITQEFCLTTFRIQHISIEATFKNEF